MSVDLCDIKTIRAVMELHGIKFKKEYGQNFLTDAETVANIAEDCCVSSETILEIGPGLGCMTRELAERYKRVIAVEIDEALIPVLKDTLYGLDNVTVVNSDIMKTDIFELLGEYIDGGVSVCANLPYYITTPILMKLVESKFPFDYITVMVQSEVADRLTSEVGGKDCGAITASLAYYGEAERLFSVPAELFVPQPKVNSAVVRIRMHKEKPVVPLDEGVFFRTVKASFEQRRKTLPNSLMTGFSEIPKQELTEIISSCGIDPRIRGERLTLEEFCALSDALTKVLNEKK